MLVLEDGLEPLLGVLDVRLEEATDAVPDLLVVENLRIEIPPVL